MILATSTDTPSTGTKSTSARLQLHDSINLNYRYVRSGEKKKEPAEVSENIRLRIESDFHPPVVDLFSQEQQVVYGDVYGLPQFPLIIRRDGCRHVVATIRFSTLLGYFTVGLTTPHMREMGKILRPTFGYRKRFVIFVITAMDKSKQSWNFA